MFDSWERQPLVQLQLRGDAAEAATGSERGYFPPSSAHSVVPRQALRGPPMSHSGRTLGEVTGYELLHVGLTT